MALQQFDEVLVLSRQIREEALVSVLGAGLVRNIWSLCIHTYIHILNTYV
jgi:hypothetical protein